MLSNKAETLLFLVQLSHRHNGFRENNEYILTCVLKGY